MYINVRTFDGKKNVIIPVSKTLPIEELKSKIQPVFGVEPERQRLFFRGKLLVEEHTLFDYNINLNDVVQMMIKDNVAPKETTSEDAPNVKSQDENEASSSEDVSNAKTQDQSDASTSEEISNETSDTICTENAESTYFKIGDLVDVVDVSNGTWLEGKIISVTVNKSAKTNLNSKINDGLMYKVLLDSKEEIDEVIGSIRPRARHLIDRSSLKEGDKVLANYNVDDPNERGHWYECTVSKISSVRTRTSEVFVNICIGGKPLIENAKLKFCNEIFKLEEPQLVTERAGDEYQQPVPKRKTIPTCSTCRDRPHVKCKECGCHICGLKTEPDKQILCDECDMAYHLQCLNPPLDSVPLHDDWYCPLCVNDENEIVKPGEKLKKSKKKEKMASSSSSSTRDWGKGMACVGRTKECTLVPSNHFGPIPGVEVGTCWKFRLQVSEAGVHRPHVAGIHGRESDGAYSIVLSGGYEDDVDNGETFLYTGSGGRDLSGNKRTAEQSCDQTLTRMNKALALNCNAPLSDTGAKSKNWKQGKPIRVVRNCKAAKHSKFAPEEGNRYDGIYKVVEYYPQKGKSGFIVWRYVLQRDDSSPAPWTKEGKKHIDELGLKIIYPEGYLEAEAAKAETQTNGKHKKESGVGKTKKRPLKQKQITSFETKRMKIEEFTLEDEIAKAIEDDNANEKLWLSCKSMISEGKPKFLSLISDTFVCICCQELVYNPVSTDCKHNFCLSCLKRAFKAEVYSCPTCRADLGRDFEMKVNESLSFCLLKLFPGYGAGR